MLSCLTGQDNFYPRSPRGERLPTTIHEYFNLIFLSTLPARGATSFSPSLSLKAWNISIHAPREGSDTCCTSGCSTATHFYPRSPRGERRCQSLHDDADTHFYPRSPRGERRWSSVMGSTCTPFLSTLPARGATFTTAALIGDEHIFLSTLPARGATGRQVY